MRNRRRRITIALGLSAVYAVDVEGRTPRFLRFHRLRGRARVQARQAFVRDRLGIALRDEVLPLSCTPAYLAPFWLSPDRALAFA